MAGINKVVLVGHTGSDPEVRYLTDGTAVTNLSLATSERYKEKKSGESKEVTEWHRLVFYGKLAEIVGEYVRKGGLIYVEGKIKTEKYTDKQTGADKFITKIICDKMQMLGGKAEAPTPGNIDSGAAAYAKATGRSTRPPADDFDDNIPF